jgi:hypothetical protein
LLQQAAERPVHRRDKGRPLGSRPGSVSWPGLPPVSWPGERGLALYRGRAYPLCRGRSSPLCHGHDTPGHDTPGHDTVALVQWSDPAVRRRGPCAQPRREDRRGSGTCGMRGDSGTATDTSRRLTFMYLTRNGIQRVCSVHGHGPRYFTADVVIVSKRRAGGIGERESPGFASECSRVPPCGSPPFEIPADQRPRERRRTGLEPIIWRADHASGWQVPAKRNGADRVEPDE